MNALFEPAPSEQLEPIECLSSGQPNPLPADLPPGCLLRIGPNPQPGFDCPSFLDGDGMVHAITVPPQRPPGAGGAGANGGNAASSTEAHETPKYSRTYVRAKGFAIEEGAGGKQIFAGTLVAPRGLPMVQALAGNAFGSRGGMVQKDTANTALSFHGGRLLALMEQARPTELAATKGGRVRTLAAATDLGGAVPPAPVTGGALSAHHRVDPASGDLVSLSYATAAAPFVRHDVFGADGALKQSRGVDTPLPVMVHDLAITADHTLLLDLPMTVRISRVLSDRFPVEYEPEAGARIGAIPRSPRAQGHPQAGGGGGGGGGEVVWCEVEPCVVLHTCNAYARAADGCVVLTASRALPKGPQSFICEYTPSFLHEWVLDFGHGGEEEKEEGGEAREKRGGGGSGESGGNGGKMAKGRVVSERCVRKVVIDESV